MIMKSKASDALKHPAINDEALVVQQVQEV
jgi:hypothetical protein